MELAGLLDRFLASLDRENRRIFMRRYWYFSPVKEIAADFGLSESKVKTALYRMRNRLKELLEKEGVGTLHIMQTAQGTDVNGGRTPDFLIYVNQDEYCVRETEQGYVIEPLLKAEDLPPCLMEISWQGDVSVKDALAQQAEALAETMLSVGEPAILRNDLSGVDALLTDGAQISGYDADVYGDVSICSIDYRVDDDQNPGSAMISVRHRVNIEGGEYDYLSIEMVYGEGGWKAARAGIEPEGPEITSPAVDRMPSGFLDFCGNLR